MISRILLAAWFILAGLSHAHAAPVFGLVGMLASTAIGKLVIGVALQYGASLLQKMRNKGKEQVPGIKTTIEIGGISPQSFIVGTFATAGHLPYANSWGTVNKTPNAGLCQVISLSDLPVTSISNDVWMNGAKLTRNPALGDQTLSHSWFGTGSYPFPTYTKNGFYFLFAKYFPQGSTTPDAKLSEKFGADPVRPWTNDMVGRGVAYVILTSEVERDLFKDRPQALWIVEGIALYDPRKDSSVGGSGAQRWGSPETFAFSDNPAVIIYNILRGIYFGATKVYGGDIPALRLPLSSWFAAMNECDVIVEGERQFRSGYEIRVEQEPLEVIEELLKACNARMAENGGIYKIHVGAPALPAYFFTDENVVISESQSSDPFPGLENTFNGVSASYPDQDAAWAMKDAPLRTNALYVASDDGRANIASVQFNAVPYPLQVQRLQKSLLEANRRFARQRITLPPEAWLLEPLDTASWSSTRNGYSSKIFEISAMDDLENVNQAVSLLEVDPSDYSWTPGTDKLPFTVGPISPITPAPQPIIDWYAEPAVVYDTNGKARRPAIKLSWDGVQADLQGVEYEIRLASTSAHVYRGRTDQPQTGSSIISQSLLPAETYQARGRYIPFTNRQTLWSGWLTVTTPDLRFGPEDIYPISVEQLGDDIKKTIAWMGDGTRQLILDAQRKALHNADQDFANYRDKSQVRQELTSTFGTANAEWTLDILLATGPDSALAQRVETLGVSVNGARAQWTLDIEVATGPGSALGQRLEVLEVAVLDPTTGNVALANTISLQQAQITTIDGLVTANANAIVQANTSIGEISASGTFRVQAYASPGAGWSRVGLEASAGVGGTFTTAAVFLDANTSGLSRMTVAASQFIIADPSSPTTLRQPFVFTGGEASLNVLNAGLINAGVIQGFNAKMKMDCNGGYLLFQD
ncbi:phage tail protein [Mesorhizobium sp. NBSH29]|uniref:phage tail protein n=1 Tax=Mesorhizobium sp. NBSH29 TaxID=2654249 RepID=UPI0018965F83|nr:phage tail protein [Mesorhizobium sp. NBSH29]QPC87423.1 phage tail protein [Mesorhizobium sp. NBSH29]